MNRPVFSSGASADQRAYRHDHNALVGGDLDEVVDAVDGGREGGGGGDCVAALARDCLQLAQAVVDGGGIEVGVEDDIGTQKRRVGARSCGRLTARGGAIVEIEKAAAGNLLHYGRQRTFLGGETGAEIVDHADVVGHAAEEPAQATLVLGGAGIGGQRVGAGIDLRVVERLQRNLQQQFVTGGARRGDVGCQLLVVGGKGERHVAGQRGNRVVGSLGVDAETADDNGNSQVLGVGLARPGVGVERAPAGGGDARPRPDAARL